MRGEPRSRPPAGEAGHGHGSCVEGDQRKEYSMLSLVVLLAAIVGATISFCGKEWTHFTLFLCLIILVVALVLEFGKNAH
jgi:hypothetical protein